MIIGVLSEAQAGETRVSVTPTTVTALAKLGYQVVVEPGAGLSSSFPDDAYLASGAAVGDPLAADVVFGVNPPSAAQLDGLRPGAVLISLLSPALRPDLVEDLARRPITALAMDAVPRISRAQSLDVLSSMANIAGYRAVIEAAHEFGRFFTGQVTAAGKVAPAKVLVCGAGVAGLAAIGAAGSLGAIVRATDPRPEVGDQVRSLGGEYLSISSPEVEVSATGYAKEMGDDYRVRETALYAAQAADVDIIVTTALIPGRAAPRLIPTGEIRPVADTPFDFRRPALLGSRIRTPDAQLFHGLGYDHCFVLAMEARAKPQHAVRVYDPPSGRVLAVETDQPGVQGLFPAISLRARSRVTAAWSTGNPRGWRWSRRIFPMRRISPVSRQPCCNRAPYTDARSAITSPRSQHPKRAETCGDLLRSAGTGRDES